MRLSLTAAVLLSVSLASAAALPSSGFVKVPLSRRSQTTDENGVVDAQFLRNQLAATQAKISRGMQAYEKNTGKTHPLDNGALHKRQLFGDEPLVSHNNNTIWSGTIQVGTPPVTFTGLSRPPAELQYDADVRL